MKKTGAILLAVALVVGLVIPMTAIVSASPATMTVVSNTSVLIIGVHNKAGGVSSFVDLSSSPLNAVRAWEPDPYSTTYPAEPAEATDSTWDNGVNWFEDNGSAADWIWETHIAEDPASYTGPLAGLYDADAARYGRVVRFETTFNIPGTLISATLHIAADNGYEAWVNTGTHYRSPTATAGWETSNLTESWLTTSGWQAVGHYNVVVDLQSGSNTLCVLAGNEYFWGDDTGNFDNPTVGTWGVGGYHQYNPGAVIFQLDIEYEESTIEVEKDYRYTNVCFEKDNDNDDKFNEDPVNGVDDDGDGSIDEDPVDCPLGSYLGDPLPMDNGNYVLEAVIHPKNNKILSYNPGQYYAVSTVNVTDDVDTLTIVEDWSDCGCGGDPISVLNPPKGGGSVVIVQVGGEINGVPVPDPSAAYQIFDATSDAIAVDATACTANATLEDVAAGTIIYMYVKFGPGLKGETWAGPYGPCVNYNRASVVEEPTVPEDWIEASANLILVAKD